MTLPQRVNLSYTGYYRERMQIDSQSFVCHCLTVVTYVTDNIRRTYSPTQTETYVYCPMLRTLKCAERWEPRKIGKKQLGGILGTGFAKGMAVYNTARKNQATVNINDCISAAVCSINESLEKIKTEGYFIGEYDQS